MTSTLVTDIGLLITNSSEFGDLTDAAFVVDQGKITWIGSKGAAPQCDRQYSVAGRTVIPGFVDSHAHLIFAGDRAAEFEARMSGTHYSAGGISTTVAATRAASDEELQANCSRLVAELQASGITTFEIKSGYGLTVEDELRSLRIARDFTEEVTFLGAHVVPKEYADRRADYVDLVIGMIPGIIGISMPLDCTRSTKSKYASALKKYCVIALFAPARTLWTKCAKSFSGPEAWGCISG